MRHKKLKIPHTIIIAEAGVNHNGSMESAKRLIDVAIAAGADYVKFQTFNWLIIFTNPLKEMINPEKISDI